jgi:formate dehydrogenase subunit gamma
MNIRWHTPDENHLVRYSFLERATHAVVAVNCIYLVMSGLALHTPYLFWIASVLGGPAMMRYFHPLLGAIYFVSLVYMWWMWRNDLWIKEQDKRWMSKVEAYMTNHDDEMPPVDRWNPGQKIFFWIMAVSGVGLLLSGIVLWLPEFVPWKLQWLKFLAILLHAACAYASIGGLLIHVYMGVFLVKGGFSQIITGDVTRLWAKHHHRLWYSRVTNERIDG